MMLIALLNVVALATAQIATSTRQASVPTSNAGATGPISRSFPGFGISSDALVEFVGKPGSPNNFSLNLIRSVFSRTGGTPIIRVGGTDGDAHAKYVPHGDSTGYKGEYSPYYFQAFKNFLPEVKYLFQVPFRPLNVSNTVEFFKAGYAVIGPDHIESVAIGNEEGSQFTKGDYQSINYPDYVGNYTRFEDAIVSSTNLPNPDIFQIADGASKERQYGIFNPHGMFENGIDKNGRVNAVAYHLYQEVFSRPANLQSTLMNHTAIVMKLDQYKNDIHYVTKNHPNTSFVLSEVGNGEEDGDPIQESFGSALWQADIQMYCMTLGVARMNFENHNHSGHNEWVVSPKQVRPNYYAHPFVADFIGNSTEDTSAAMFINTTLLTGYAAYDGSGLKRIALVNFKLWPEKNTTEALNSTRPSVAVELTGLPSTVSSVRLQQLTSHLGGYAMNASDIAYDETRWTPESNGMGVSTGRKSKSQNVTNGAVTVNVKDSEAILLVLEGQ